jgi:hypothetical protein
MKGINMATRGGARAGAGAPQGTRKITKIMLQQAIESKTGQKFEDSLAEIFETLFTKFRKGENIKEFLGFVENMCKRIIEEDPQRIELTSQANPEEIEKRLAELTSKYMVATMKTTGRPKKEDEINIIKSGS